MHRLIRLVRYRVRSLTLWCSVVIVYSILRLSFEKYSTITTKEQTGLPYVTRLAQITTTHTPAPPAPPHGPVANCTFRPHHVLPAVHDKWYAYFNPPTHNKVFIYSAFMDDRPQNIIPKVRLLVVSSRIINDTFCQFWYDNKAEPLPVKASITRNGRGHKIAGSHYDQYYFTCNPPSPHPTLVSVTSRPCELPQSMVPITYPSRAVEHQFAVCVPITFGKVDPYRFIEWMEAQQILGVTEVNIYYVHMSEASLAPFRYYERLGVVKLKQMPTVPEWENSYNGNKLSSMVSLNDCLYTNLYRVKWIIGVDFDEVIIPRSASVKDYKTLLQTIDNTLSASRDKGVKSYTFSNAYFWVGCSPPTFKEPKGSVIMRHARREPLSKPMVGAKTILSPLSCVSLFNHYCYHPFKVRGKAATIRVNVTIATSHHYRLPLKKAANCERLSVNGTQDMMAIQQLAPHLEKRYLAVIKETKLVS